MVRAFNLELEPVSFRYSVNTETLRLTRLTKPFTYQKVHLRTNSYQPRDFQSKHCLRLILNYYTPPLYIQSSVIFKAKSLLKYFIHFSALNFPGTGIQGGPAFCEQSAKRPKCLSHTRTVCWEKLDIYYSRE